MIAKTSESTVSSSSAGNLKSASEDDALFYQLDPSELLKHLLGTSSGETVQCDSQRKKVNQATKNSSTVTQSKQINAASRSETCDSTSCFELDPVETAPNVNNGTMATCVENRAHLCQCDVQSSQRFGDSCSGFEELPRELLENEALEFILLEAQKSMCVESPPSSSESECWEFAELQNVAPGPVSEVALSGPTVNDGDEEENVNEMITDAGDSVDSDDCDDVDEAMVLVPAGKFLVYKVIDLMYVRFGSVSPI